MNTARAVFLDKDGTLVEDVPYNADPGLVRLLPGAAEGLRALRAAGFRLVVVSNQSGVARGRFPASALVGIERRLRELLAEADLTLDDVRFCPHHPEGAVPAFSIPCACRKPNPGLILSAAATLGIDLRRSWMIGDKPDDVEAGRRAGCRTIRIARSPHPGANAFAEADAICEDLIEASSFILSSQDESAKAG